MPIKLFLVLLIASEVTCYNVTFTLRADGEKGDPVVNKSLDLYRCWGDDLGQDPSCQNGGAIIESNETALVCKCTQFYEGNCCQENRCILGGYRLDDENECQCPHGQSGNHCEQVSCNGGQLVYHQGEHFCDCPVDRQGRYCEHTRCLHGGSMNTEGCACIPGFYGTNCQYINCNHGWRIPYSDGHYRCKCTLLYEGQFCENYHVGVACLLCFSITFVAVMLFAVLLCYWKAKVLRRNPQARSVVLRDQGKPNPSLQREAAPLLPKPTPPTRRSKQPNITENPLEL